MGNINLNITFQHPAAVSNTIRYGRIDNTNTPTYITIPNLTGTSYSIQNVANGQYRIFVTPNYADGRVCQAVMLQTDPCTGLVLFSATYTGGNFVVSFNANVNVPKVQLNVSFPNGGLYTQQYDNVAGDIIYAPPAGVYGPFTLTMQPVCDADSGFLGVPSAPVVLEVAAPSNTVLLNSSSGPFSPLSVTTNSPEGSVLVFSATIVNAASPQNLTIPDGSYTTIVINYGSGTPATATLTTGSGSYTGAFSGGAITFSAVTMDGGGTITIT